MKPNKRKVSRHSPTTKRRKEEEAEAKKALRKQEQDEKASEKAERSAKKMERKAAKDAEKKLHADRLDDLRRRRAADTYCYCEKEYDKTYVMLQCSGLRRCPLRAWVHEKCAKEPITEQMRSGKDDFWCEYCMNNFKPAVDEVKADDAGSVASH